MIIIQNTTCVRKTYFWVKCKVFLIDIPDSFVCILIDNIVDFVQVLAHIQYIRASVRSPVVASHITCLLIALAVHLCNVLRPTPNLLSNHYWFWCRPAMYWVSNVLLFVCMIHLWQLWPRDACYDNKIENYSDAKGKRTIKVPKVYHFLSMR